MKATAKSHIKIFFREIGVNPFFFVIFVFILTQCRESKQSKPNEYIVVGATDSPFILEADSKDFITTKCNSIDKQADPKSCVKSNDPKDIIRVNKEERIKRIREVSEILEIGQKSYTNRTEDGETVFAKTFFPKSDETAKLLLLLLTPQEIEK